MSMLSSVGYDDTPKETLGSFRISTAETVFQKTRENKIKLGEGGGGREQERRQEKFRRRVAWPSNGIMSATQPCYIMDGMGECECCIRQGGLQGRADTEDTPEASPLMPDMLLRLQGFS